MAATIAQAKWRQSIAGASSSTRPLDAESGKFDHLPIEEIKYDPFLAEFRRDKVKRLLHTLPCVGERPS